MARRLPLHPIALEPSNFPLARDLATGTEKTLTEFQENRKKLVDVQLLQIVFAATENWNRQSDATGRPAGSSCWLAAEVREGRWALAQNFVAVPSAEAAEEATEVEVAAVMP